MNLTLNEVRCRLVFAITEYEELRAQALHREITLEARANIAIRSMRFSQCEDLDLLIDILFNLTEILDRMEVLANG